jgi:hypothetical protein
MPIRTDDTLLRMALAGFEVERQRIQAKIDEINARLGGLRGRAATATAGSQSMAGGRRQMSAAARRRIAAAQKKRWAEYRKKKAA